MDDEFGPSHFVLSRTPFIPLLQRFSQAKFLAEITDGHAECHIAEEPVLRRLGDTGGGPADERISPAIASNITLDTGVDICNILIRRNLHRWQQFVDKLKRQVRRSLLLLLMPVLLEPLIQKRQEATLNHYETPPNKGDPLIFGKNPHRNQAASPPSPTCLLRGIL